MFMLFTTILIYINDLPSAGDMFSMLRYVGDTTLFCNFDNNCNVKVFNAKLNNVHSWLCSNRLSLNVGKAKYVSFTQLKKYID